MKTDRKHLASLCSCFPFEIFLNQITPNKKNRMNTCLNCFLLILNSNIQSLYIKCCRPFTYEENPENFYVVRYLTPTLYIDIDVVKYPTDVRQCHTFHTMETPKHYIPFYFLPSFFGFNLLTFFCTKFSFYFLFALIYIRKNSFCMMIRILDYINGKAYHTLCTYYIYNLHSHALHINILKRRKQTCRGNGISAKYKEFFWIILNYVLFIEIYVRKSCANKENS